MNEPANTPTPATTTADCAQHFVTHGTSLEHALRDVLSLSLVEHDDSIETAAEPHRSRTAGATSYS